MAAVALTKLLPMMAEKRQLIPVIHLQGTADLLKGPMM